MARVTGKYNVDFERGDGGFKSVFGTFIGTRLKENKEQYKRELKAADPTYEGKQLTALRKERADLLKELRGGGSSASGGSTRSSWTSGAKDAAEQQLKLKAEKLKAQNTYMQGVEAGGTPESQIISLRDVGPSAANLESDLKRILEATTSGMGFPGKMNAGKHGIGEGILNAMKNVDGMPQSTIDQAKSFLRASGYEASKEAQAIYEDPDLITTQEQNLIDIIKQGGTGGSTTTKLGAGLDPNTRNALLIKQLKQINSEIKKQQGVYSTTKSDYLDLVANPGRNFALSPTSSRPSVLSQSMDMYADVYEADPRYAKRLLDESSEAGRITVPDRFEGLKSVDGAGGKSPIDILMDTSSTLAILRGTTGKEGDVERTLDADDVRLVRGSLDRMRRAMKSPMFDEQKYGDIKGPGGKSMPIGKFLDDVTNQFDSVPENMKAQYSQAISDKIIEWSKTQDEKKLKAARRDYNPKYAVTQSLDRIQAAKRKFDNTGDSKVLRETIATEYNILNDTDKEIRGAGGDAALQRIDDFMSVSEDNRNIDFLSNDLQDLSSVLMAQDLSNVPTNEGNTGE
jgi:hypothetical protein